MIHKKRGILQDAVHHPGPVELLLRIPLRHVLFQHPNQALAPGAHSPQDGGQYLFRICLHETQSGIEILSRQQLEARVPDVRRPDPRLERRVRQLHGLHPSQLLEFQAVQAQLTKLRVAAELHAQHAPHLCVPDVHTPQADVVAPLPALELRPLLLRPALSQLRQVPHRTAVDLAKGRHPSVFQAVLLVGFSARIVLAEQKIRLAVPEGVLALRAPPLLDAGGDVVDNLVDGFFVEVIHRRIAADKFRVWLLQHRPLLLLGILGIMR